MVAWQVAAQIDSNDAAESSPVQAFLRAAGLEADSVAGLDADTLMATLGQLFRETVVGLDEVLQDQARHRSTLGLDTTAIQHREKNPLKFASHALEAMALLLRDNSLEHLPSVTAVRQVFHDIRQHEAATWCANRQAFFGFLEHLDPAALEEHLDDGQKRRSTLPGAAHTWHQTQYRELYEALTRHTGEHFPPLYHKAFKEAYRQALDALQTARQRA